MRLLLLSPSCVEYVKLTRLLVLHVPNWAPVSRWRGPAKVLFRQRSTQLAKAPVHGSHPHCPAAPCTRRRPGAICTQAISGKATEGGPDNTVRRHASRTSSAGNREEQQRSAVHRRTHVNRVLKARIALPKELHTLRQRRGLSVQLYCCIFVSILSQIVASPLHGCLPDAVRPASAARPLPSPSVIETTTSSLNARHRPIPAASQPIFTLVPLARPPALGVHFILDHVADIPTRREHRRCSRTCAQGCRPADCRRPESQDHKTQV